MSSLLFEVEPYDRASFVAAPLVLVAIAFAAAWRPATNATSVDPTIALRAE